MNAASSATRQIEPIVGTLRIIGGTRLEDAAPCATALTTPPRAARGRAGERLFILLDLTRPASPHLYRELREVVAQTYWSSTGSITAALRQAATTANRHMFRVNLRSAPSDRCDGSLICAVLHGDDLFILQAGPCRACFLHLRGEYLECFSRGEEPPPMGTGQVADVRLYHTFVTPGDTLLLASPALTQEAGEEAVSRVLPRAEVQEVLAGLEQVGAGADLVAMIVRWALPPAGPQAEAPAAREAPRSFAPPRAPASSDLGDRASAAGLSRVAERREPPRPKPRARPKSARSFSGKLGPSLGERVKRGVGSMGRGIATVGAGLIGGASTLFRRMLPGAERKARRRATSRRPVPEENRIVMITVAIGIPVVLAIIVALAYFSFGGKDTHSQRLIHQAEEEIALAHATGGITEGTRFHWEAALGHASAAAEWRPDDPAAIALQAQAQAALDFLDGVIRLRPIQLWDFGPGTIQRQLVIHGQMVFVLDPAEGWVAQLTLNPTGDGVVEQENATILVQTGQQVGEREVGDLVDFAWVGPRGERQTSGLLILEEDGAMIGYDPAWVDEGGTPRLTRSLLGTPPTGTPRAVGSFGGRFYILDPDDDQIWRYEPQGDTYPEHPDRYFVTPPLKPLETALDMAIDGSIYILYADGTILKFLRRELQPFDVSGLFDDTSQAVALAVDSDSSGGAIYVADRGNGRVVALEPDGAFRAQFCAEVFDALETLAVDEAAKQLYVISDGRFYVASLP
jgi:hypothetical protein